MVSLCGYGERGGGKGKTPWPRDRPVMALDTPATGCLRAAVVRGAGGELRKRPIYQLVGQLPSGPQAEALLP